MTATALDIIGALGFERYPKMSIENTYNMVISSQALVPFSGYSLAQTFTADINGRQLFRSSFLKDLIAVINNRVYLINKNLGFALVGNLTTSTGPVFITENEANQIALVDGVNLYIFEPMTSNFSIVPLDFSPVYITFQDGYFISCDGQTSQWRLSGLNNGFSWPAGPRNIGLLQTRPTFVKAVIAFERQLFVMGETVTEIWHAQPSNSLFPYVRSNAIAINYGLLSPSSVASEFGLLVWVASNNQASPTILVSKGGPPKRLSTDGIDFLLGSLDFPERSTAFLFEEDGHIFYQITFERDNLTLVYDFETNQFYTLTDECLNAHIARNGVFFNNKNYFLSRDSGDLYEFGTQFTTYNGKSIPRIRITKPFRMKNSKRFIANNINITLEQGISNQLQRVDLSISKNGGQSFGTVVGKELNSLGNYRNRLQFWNLGICNDLTLQFRFWAGNPLETTRNDQCRNGSERFVIVGGELNYFQ